MLRELAIRDLGVIDDAVVEPSSGLTCITGETGAGKTMVMSGLGLIAGAKADPGLIRRGARRAVVEARFDDIDDELAGAVAERGGELDDGELIVARHLVGRSSRAFVGGAQVPAAVVGELLGDRVTLHGQSEQIRLGTPERQRDVLDRAGGTQHRARVTRYRDLWNEHRAVVTELEVLRAAAQERAREIDVLRFGLDEIAGVDPQPGEDGELAAQAERLHAADDLRRSARAALAAIAGADDGDPDAPGALGLVAVARKALDGDDAALRNVDAQLKETALALSDAAGTLASYLADLDSDPTQLESIAARRAELQRLTRKYGDTADDVLAWAAQAAERLSELDASDERIAELEARRDRLRDERDAVGVEISAGRARAAARLAEAIELELRALAMPHARLEFRLTPLAEPGPGGHESVALLFSANPGSEPGPLGKVASGGELSRVRLAVEVVVAEESVGHAFVFDEVDAGVGGAVALEIGRRLARLAEHAQVLVVTHLAQVAAFADVHLVVAKSSDGQVTTSGLRRVEGDDRATELARMMGGLDAESARAHARDLLAEARARQAPARPGAGGGGRRGRSKAGAARTGGPEAE